MSDTSLNLYTFEAYENQNSQYVLTSPRSLQACRQLNLKPIDLLPKSEEQLAEERPDLNAEQRHQVLQRFETNRIKHLEAARIFRENIIQRSKLKKLDSVHSVSSNGSKKDILREEAPLTYRDGFLVDICVPSARDNNVTSQRSTESVPEQLEVPKCFREDFSIPTTASEPVDKRSKDRSNITLQISQEEPSAEKYENEISEKNLNVNQNFAEYSITSKTNSDNEDETKTENSIIPLRSSGSPRKGQILLKNKTKVSKFSRSSNLELSGCSSTNRPSSAVTFLETRNKTSHWTSSQKLNPTKKGSFLYRPNSAGKRKIPKSRLGSSDDAVNSEGAATDSFSGNLATDRRPSSALGNFGRSSRYRPTSSYSRRKPQKNVQLHSSDSDVSPRRTSSSALDRERGRSKTRSLRRHKSSKVLKKSSHTSALSDALQVPKSYECPEPSVSPSSLSVPLTSRPSSATSNSSFSSLSSNSIAFDLHSKSRRRIKNIRVKNIPLSSRPYSSPTNRPESSMSVPIYLRNPKKDENTQRTRVGRSNSARLPRSKVCTPSWSPGGFGMYRTTSTVSLADSQILAKFLTDDDKNLEVPEHDRRILELLALKHEKLHQEEIKASIIHKQWTKDRENEIKENSKMWQEWRKNVNEKRHIENTENERRWRFNEQRFHQSQENLASLLRGKEKRAHELLETQYDARQRRLEEKRMRDSSKKAVIDATLKAKEEQQERMRQQLIELWDRQQKLVELRKKEREEIYKKRMGEASDEAEQQHRERIKQVEAEGLVLLEAMKRSMEERLQRAETNLRGIQKMKDDLLNKNRDERIRKAATVQALHDKLEADLLQWRQHVLHHQMKMTKEAEIRFHHNIFKKSTTAQESLQIRQEHHRQLFEQVKEKEKCEEIAVRQHLASKDLRSFQISREKEFRIQRAKSIAFTTASIREDLRKKFSPETFDRKVARAKIEHRIESPPQRQHPMAAASHIFLG